MTTAKPHLSPSQLESFCRCGEAYRRRYLEGEIIPPSAAMMRGTSVHRAASANFKQKKETRRDLPLGDFRDMAAAEFDACVAGGYCLTEDESARGASVVLGEAKDDAVVMAEVHGERQAPDYQPAMVEERVRISLPMADRDLLGVIDLADEKDRVVDFKTAARRKNQAEADSSVQLTTYHAAFLAFKGRAPAELRLDTIVKTKTRVDRDVITTARGPRDLQALAFRVNAVLAALKSGVFTPATPGAWWCDPRYCGYFASCRYVNSERRAAAEGSPQ
jgi:hypothetical protein